MKRNFKHRAEFSFQPRENNMRASLKMVWVILCQKIFAPMKSGVMH